MYLLIVLFMSMTSFIILFKIDKTARYQNTIIPILIGIYQIIISVINLPCLISYNGNVNFNFKFLNLLFELYDLNNFGYILISNILINACCVIISYFILQKNRLFDKKVLKKEYNNFCSDADRLTILGYDLSFLLNEGHKPQLNRIKELGRNCTIICKKNNRPKNYSANMNSKESVKYIKLMKLYKELISNNVKIRCYSNITNEKFKNLQFITGQIKCCQANLEAKLIYKSENKFRKLDIDNSYIVQILDDSIKDFYNELYNPIIKCVVIDFSLFKFDESIKNILNFFEKKHNVKYDYTLFENIELTDYLTNNYSNVIANMEVLYGKEFEKVQKNKIKKKFNNEFTLNEKFKEILKQMNFKGYKVKILIDKTFSNESKNKLEKIFAEINSNINLIFLNEIGLMKQSEKIFDQLSVNINYYGNEIMLIDSSEDFRNRAKEKSWNALSFNQHTNNIEELVKKLYKYALISK